MDRKGHGSKQSGPNQIYWHLPGGCDKTTSHLRIASVPIKVLAGYFQNTSHCHTNLLGLYKLLLTILNMTTSEWCRCFYYFDQQRHTWFLHGPRCTHYYCTVCMFCRDNLHKTYFTDDHGTLLTRPTVHISSFCTGLSCERMKQVTECCYDSHVTLSMPHILHSMSKLASYKIFALVWLHHPSICKIMLNHWVRSSCYFEGTYCLHLQQFRGPTIQGEYIT